VCEPTKLFVRIEKYELNKICRYTVKVIVSSMAIVTIGMMLFIWRVSNGPVELDGYSPLLRNVLIEQGIGQNIQFDRSILTWRSAENNPTGNSSFEVRFLNFYIENRQTGMTLQIPEAGMQFSPTALFRGVLAPTFVEFSGLELNVLVPADVWNGEPFDQDAFVLAMRTYLDEFNNSPDLVPRLTKQLLAAPSTLTSTGYLQQLTLADTKVNLTDELSGDVWQIPDAILDIRRVDDGLSLLLEGALDFEDDNDISLHMSISYSIPEEKATTQIKFINLVPKKIAGEVEGLSGLSTLDIDVSGTINFSVDKNFDLPVFDFEVDIGSGQINPAKLYNTPIKIDEALLNGRFLSAKDEVEIDEFYLKFDGATISANGTIRSFRDDPDIVLTANVGHMPLTNLAVYWPPGLLQNARLWIEGNITGGTITDGTIDVNIKPDMWVMEQLPDDSFIFNFNVVEGEAHFLKPMPQLVNMNGSATLRLNHFLLNIDSANVENVTLENAVLNFNDISRKGLAIADFEIPINGRIEDILRIIDNQPLGYPSQYGIKQDSVVGDAITHLTLNFPLITDLKISEVEFNVEADIENLAIPGLTDELAITEGTMSLFVSRDGITSNGDIVLNGIDFAAEWTEDFDGENNSPTRYSIAGDISGDEWGRLGLPFEEYTEGPANASLTLVGKGADLQSGIGHFDLKDTNITFEPLGWLKAGDNVASTDFSLVFDDRGNINVNDITFKSDRMKSELELVYDGERTTRLFIQNLEMLDEGGALLQDFTGLFEWDRDNRLYQVSIKGNKFNAVPIMDIILNPVEGDDEADLPDFNLAGSIANVAMYNDVEMQETTILAGYINNEMIDFGYNGKWGDGKNVSIIIATMDDLSAPQKLTLKTNDAGQALRALDFFTSGDQGDLLIVADMERMEKGFSMKGTIDAGNFRVANSPAFNELLREKEFAKAQEELEKNGLSFESFESEFTQYDDVMTFKSGSAKGPSLGITVDGYIDQKFDEISLGGTIIPAYGINSLLSNIPLLGTILVGGKGEGVFSATYNMQGSVEDPNVNINPLMVLAPGIFRKIFGAIGGDNNTPSAREEAEIEEEEQAAAADVSQSGMPPD
jgi:hypothetical protein